MPKKVFWPVSAIVMGLIFLASNLGMLPREFYNLWPLMLIIVGLGGLLVSDRDEWLVENTSPNKSRAARKPKARKKSSKKKK